MDMELLLDDFKEWAKRNLKEIILFAVAFIVVIVGLMISSSQRNMVKNADNQVSQVKSQIEAYKTKSDAQSVSADGLDTARVEKDESVLEKFYKVAFSFKSEDEYNDVRSSVRVDYKLDDKSEFFKYFYQSISDELADGQSEPLESHARKSTDKYDCAYKNMTNYVYTINDGVYTYISDVILTSNGKDYEVVIIPSVDVHGNIVSIEGYTVTE